MCKFISTEHRCDPIMAHQLRPKGLINNRNRTARAETGFHCRRTDLKRDIIATQVQLLNCFT
jgi:hypothetical protein